MFFKSLLLFFFFLFCFSQKCTRVQLMLIVSPVDKFSVIFLDFFMNKYVRNLLEYSVDLLMYTFVNKSEELLISP